MRPSNTRPQHHAPDGPPIRPHARSDRPSAVEHPTYARHPSVRLDSCLRRNDGGERRSDGGERRSDEGAPAATPPPSAASSPHSACEIASPTNPGQARSRINCHHPIAPLGFDPGHDLFRRAQYVDPPQLQLVPAPAQLRAARAVPLTPRQIDPNQPPWHLRSPLSSLRPFPSFLRRQESMRPSNTRPQHHAADGPPNPSARAIGPSQRRRTSNLRSAPLSPPGFLPAQGMTEGGAGATEGSAGVTEEGPRPERSKARCRPHTPRQIDPNQPPWHLRSPLSSLRPFPSFLRPPPPSFLRRQESMRPSNTRPSTMPPTAHRIRPHARSDRPSAVEHPTYARRPSVRLDSCLRRNDGGGHRSAEGVTGATEGGAGATEGVTGATEGGAGATEGGAGMTEGGAGATEEGAAGMNEGQRRNDGGSAGMTEGGAGMTEGVTGATEGAQE